MFTQVRLQQFRSYLDRSFKLQKGVNLVVGPNASGKTNLLEAILCICRGSSYRIADSGLIMHDQNWARVDADFDGATRTIKLHHQQRLIKEYILEEKIYKRIVPSIQIPVVVFEPDHLLMLSGSPELRRRYLDAILEQTNPSYRKLSADYVKTLRQRNALLKSTQVTSKLLFPWNIRLSHLGGQVALERTKLTHQLNWQLPAAYSRLANDEKQISLGYQSVVAVENYESLLNQKLETSLELDMIRGHTTYGPHREDLKIWINSSPVDEVASRGEVRSIVIALKFLEANLIAAKTNQQPIILLDDVFSELDIKRREALIDFLTNRQSFITATNADVFTDRVAVTNLIKL